MIFSFSPLPPLDIQNHALEHFNIVSRNSIIDLKVPDVDTENPQTHLTVVLITQGDQAFAGSFRVFFATQANFISTTNTGCCLGPCLYYLLGETFLAIKRSGKQPDFWIRQAIHHHALGLNSSWTRSMARLRRWLALLPRMQSRTCCLCR